MYYERGFAGKKVSGLIFLLNFAIFKNINRFDGCKSRII